SLVWYTIQAIVCSLPKGFPQVAFNSTKSLTYNLDKSKCLSMYRQTKEYTNLGKLDPNFNKMCHWVDLQEPLGIIKKDFPLSTQPVKGTWRIIVKANSCIVAAVLPKFEVSVTLPPYVLKKDTRVLGHVTSKYTYGKGVRGTVELYAYFDRRKSSIKQQFEVNKTLNETASINFDVKEIKELFHSTYTWARENYLYEWRYQLKINATVTNKLTGKTASKKQSVSFYLSDVKLEFPSFNPTNFKPGLPFVIIAGFRNGSRSVTKAWFSASKSLSPSNSFIQLSTSTPSVKVSWILWSTIVSVNLSSQSLSGEKIHCQVTSNFPMSMYNYVVMGRGSLRHIGSGIAQDNGYNATFQMTSLPIMSPSARIVVYSVTNDGEVVVDSLTVSVENPFKNQVSLEFSKNTSRPGDQVKLVAKATPGSHVAFLAVDKSVLLMKKDNDISRNQNFERMSYVTVPLRAALRRAVPCRAVPCRAVPCRAVPCRAVPCRAILRDLQSYSTGSGWYPWWDWGWFGFRGGCMVPFYTGGVDADSVFKNSGLIVFSDGLVYKKPVPKWRFPGRGKVFVVDSPIEGLPEARAASSKPAQATKVRSFFPETWLWIDVNSSSSGKVEISAKVPDTITSWVASVFAISPTTGFGIGSLKPKLQVFQPFFISLDLPYSVIRGEEVAIKVLVFNYLEEDQQVTITFKASKHWSSINEISVRGLHQEVVDRKEVITVRAGQGRALAFPIIPRTLGSVPLTVYAQSRVAADAVRRTLLVEPEGIPQQYSYSLLIDLNTTSSFTKTLDLSLPKTVVDGSAHVKLTLIGDILGSSFSNLDNLLRMPYGCGEQNMVNFAPNIFILKYLTAVNRVTSHIKEKAEKYMIQGYQREQTYRHKDGSYSAFGERDKEGSMWLTAFVVKSFAQARKYIYIDPSSLDLSLRWMMRRQHKNGSFPRVGYVHSSYLKGGLKGELPLTAFVVIALAEVKSSSEKIISQDVYALAITAYALKLENSASSAKALLALLRLAIRKDGTIHWTNTKQNLDKSAEFHPYYRPRSADIEITAYALLTLSLYKDIRNGLPVVRWLSQQRNSLGGYSSTQDTVLGIQAMSEFAALIYSPKLNFQLTLTHSAVTNFTKTLTVQDKNAMVLQQVLIPKAEGTLKVTAKGHGIGLLQVGVTYHVTKSPKNSNFDFVVKLVDDKNLALKRVDFKEKNLIFYFDQIYKGNATCLSVRFDRTHAVGKGKPVPAVVYDYYNPENRAEALYSSDQLKDVSVCRVCPSCVGCYINGSSKSPIDNQPEQKPDTPSSTWKTPTRCSTCPSCWGCRSITKPNESESGRNSSPGFCV
ncbi:hypothetical protein QZH41_012192, partial [Actinostola sp. cb2023]